MVCVQPAKTQKQPGKGRWKLNRGSISLKRCIWHIWSHGGFIKVPELPWLRAARSGWLRVWLCWLKLARTTLVLAHAAACCVNSVRNCTPVWMNNVQVCCSHITWLLLLMLPCECNRKSRTWASAGRADIKDSSNVALHQKLHEVHEEKEKLQFELSELCDNNGSGSRAKMQTLQHRPQWHFCKHF